MEWKTGLFTTAGDKWPQPTNTAVLILYLRARTVPRYCGTKPANVLQADVPRVITIFGKIAGKGKPPLPAKYFTTWLSD